MREPLGADVRIAHARFHIPELFELLFELEDAPFRFRSAPYVLFQSRAVLCFASYVSCRFLGPSFRDDGRIDDRSARAHRLAHVGEGKLHDDERVERHLFFARDGKEDLWLFGGLEQRRIDADFQFSRRTEVGQGVPDERCLSEHANDGELQRDEIVEAVIVGGGGFVRRGFVEEPARCFLIGGSHDGDAGGPDETPHFSQCIRGFSEEREIGDHDDVECAVANPEVSFEHRMGQMSWSLACRAREHFGHARGIGIVDVHEPRAAIDEPLTEPQRRIAEHCHAPATPETLEVGRKGHGRVRGTPGVRPDHGDAFSSSPAPWHCMKGLPLPHGHSISAVTIGSCTGGCSDAPAGSSSS